MAEPIVVHKPKRPLSAYNLFFQERRRHHRESMSDVMDGTAPRDRFGNMAKLIASEWKKLDDISKAPFVEMSRKDGIRYKKEMTRWRKLVKQASSKSKTKPCEREMDLLTEEMLRTKEDDPLMEHVPTVRENVGHEVWEAESYLESMEPFPIPEPRNIARTITNQMNETYQSASSSVDDGFSALGVSHLLPNSHSNQELSIVPIPRQQTVQMHRIQQQVSYGGIRSVGNCDEIQVIDDDMNPRPILPTTSMLPSSLGLTFTPSQWM